MINRFLLRFAVALGLSQGVQIKPLTNPSNYPATGFGGQQQSAPAAGLISSLVPGAPAPGSEGPFGFPVVNIRFTYPPTEIDGRRRLGLANTEAEIIETASIFGDSMDLDLTALLEHMRKLKQIMGYLKVIPQDMNYDFQNKLLEGLADKIPEVPSSFMDISTTKDYPQINLGIEDNSGAFNEGPEMTPAEAIVLMNDMAKSHYSNKSLVIEIIKMRFRTLQLLFEVLLPKFIEAKLGWTERRKRQQELLRSMSMRIPGISFLENGLAPAQPQPVATQGMAGPGASPTMVSGSGPNAPVGVALAAPGPVSAGASGIQSNAMAPTGNGLGSSSLPKIGVDYPMYMNVRSRVLQGGREGAKALAALIDLWNEKEGARGQLRATGVMADCRILLMDPRTPDYIKNLAGTLMTLMSGIPISAIVPDIMSGSYARVNIVIPRPKRVYLADKEIALSTGGD